MQAEVHAQVVLQDVLCEHISTRTADVIRRAHGCMAALDACP